MEFNSGYYRLKLAANPLKCLAVAADNLGDNANIIIWTSAAARAEQLFRIVRVQDGEFGFVLQARHSKKVVALPSHVPYAIQFGYQRTNPDQHFKFQPVPDVGPNAYAIIGEKRGLALSVDHTRVGVDGQLVIPWTYHNDAARQQIWIVELVAEVPARKARIPWAVTYHAAFDDGREKDWENSFDLITALGASYVRSDLPWNRLCRNSAEPNKDELAKYSAYIDAMRKKQLEPVVVLSQVPDWAAKDLSKFPGNFAQYCSVLAEALVGRVRHFQLLNEPNGPVKFPHRESSVDWTIEGVKNVAVAEEFSRNAAFEFVDVYAKAALAGDQVINSVYQPKQAEYVSWVNINCVPRWWKDYAIRFFTALGKPGTHNINLAIDHYTAGYIPWVRKDALYRWYDWEPIDSAADLVTQKGGPCEGLKLALMETGFSNFLTTLEAQANWIGPGLESALPELYLRTQIQSGKPGVTFQMCAWYCLYDSGNPPSPHPATPEGWFGIVNLDRKTRKPGFAPLERAIKAFTSSEHDAYLLQSGFDK